MGKPVAKAHAVLISDKSNVFQHGPFRVIKEKDTPAKDVTVQGR